MGVQTQRNPEERLIPALPLGGSYTKRCIDIGTLKGDLGLEDCGMGLAVANKQLEHGEDVSGEADVS